MKDDPVVCHQRERILHACAVWLMTYKDMKLFGEMATKRPLLKRQNLVVSRQEAVRSQCLAQHTIID